MPFVTTLQQFHLQGISIELFVPEPQAVQESYTRKKISFPYWSQVWPSAIALANFLLKHPHYVQQKKVLEIAAGLGLPSMVAANYASMVLCSDHEPEAVVIMQQSVYHNHLHNMHCQVLDWHFIPANLDADILLLSDVNYDPSDFVVLRKLLLQFLQKEAVIILSTPQRLAAKEFIAPLLEFCVQQEEVTILHNEGKVLITVIVLKR